MPIDILNFKKNIHIQIIMWTNLFLDKNVSYFDEYSIIRIIITK